MPSERIQRRIDRLLDETEQAMDQQNWALVQTLAQGVLDLAPENSDARTFIDIAGRRLEDVAASPSASETKPPSDRAPKAPASTPTSFVSGRYAVKRFLGEGGKKQVYLAHDELLDRDVAFALIETEGLDETGRQRIKREAQAMGRLGSHPHIVSVYDMGDEVTGPAPTPASQPYIVTELMAGGDVESLIEKAPEHRPPLERTLEIGQAVCRGLEFAHSHGIVHRDLKPGNVWLTEDGTAKLGDFGLAVALDRSRLTQAGMMVGTVSYMPPEQAMGGEVTPRSDLYSLGAMLYEMVTGRPPFVGDESVAIITQHLNAAPVAPSWHNPTVPPGLEALILRLLEKDPARRPESAAEVGQALGSIAGTREHPSLPASLPQGERGATGSDHPSPPVGEGPGMRGDARATPANPLYRRAFVGREAEVRQLQAAYDAAVSGQGGLVMVVGEPGIGKTSLCEQLATYATIRGGKALVGHCYEEGSLSLPYLPFVEAMRNYVLAREPEGLKQDLGTGAGEVARIVSEIRDRLPVELPAAGAPEDDRWRLLQAVTSFLRNAATVQPLVIVLEDLHDADRGTLDLLVHLSHNLAGARLLLVGTYRDIEVDRAHPLSGALAELRRASSFLRVPLRGLTAEEVQRMMASVSQQEIPWPLAELLHRQTEGNPLFVQEMLRYLVEEGLVERRGGALRRVGEETLAGRIPEGLRDVIGKRLSRLSAESNRLLSVAAVVGRDFRLAILQAVADVDEDTLVTAMEEATRAAVLTEQARVGDVQYRFAHAFFRQTLYEELSAPRRLRLHQQIARALERQYGARLEEHAAELAEHFAQSTDGDDLTKAVSYSELAARRAMSVYAYGEAARHLEQALEVQEVLDPDDHAKRLELLRHLIEALIPAGEPARVVEEIAPAALALTERLGDQRRATQVAGMSLTAIIAAGYPSQQAWRYQAWRYWTEVANRYAAPGTAAQVRALGALGQLRNMEGRFHDARSLYSDAFALARTLGNREMLFYTTAMIIGGAGLESAEERLRLAEEFTQAPRNGVRGSITALLLSACARTYLEWGQRDRAEEVVGEVIALSTHLHDPLSVARNEMTSVTFAMLDGRLEQALETCEALEATASKQGAPDGGPYAGGASEVAVLLGRAEELAGAVPGRQLPASVGDRLGDENQTTILAARSAWWLANTGHTAEAWSLVRQLVDRWLAAGALKDLNPGALAQLLQAAILSEDRESASVLAPMLKDAAPLLVAGSFYYINLMGLTVMARQLGAAAALLGDRDQAMRYYQQALEVAGRARFRPEIALTHLQLAELLLEDSDETQRAEALSHLDIAIGELREMKMQPALERALRHKEVLKA